VTIGLNTLKPRVLALCEVHTKEFIEPLKQVLADHGQIVATSQGEDAIGEQCHIRSCGKVLKNNSTLRSHYRQIHHLTAEQYMPMVEDNRYVETVDELADLITDKGGDRPQPKIYKCDFPGCDTEYSPDETRVPAQALGVHKAKRHGIKGEGKRRKAGAATA
jgi:hypothetical protein